MLSAREQIVADWRKHLADESQVRADDPHRAAWLARLRIRLYRFLLSLYGNGDWNAPETKETVSAVLHGAGSMDSDVERFDGKPAKNINQIRTALQSVASANPHHNETGPLADGVGDESWIAVASFGGGLNPYACADVVRRARIPHRLVARNRDVSVEVRSKQVPAATKAIFARIGRLRWFASSVEPVYPGILASASAAVASLVRRIPERISFLLATLFYLAITGPLALLCVLVVQSTYTPAGYSITIGPYSFNEHFRGVWFGFIVIVLLLALQRFEQLRQRERLARVKKLKSLARK